MELGLLSTADDGAQTLLNLATALWLASVGASIGSFLNVVAYRLPLGASIVWIPSRCPKCGSPIRLRDNIPLLSWLALRGRCRDCGVRISPRYFVVEAAMAVAFFLLAYVELFSGGANLPDGPLTSFQGAWGTIWHPEWELIGVYFYHCALLSVLMTVALIDLDDARVPWKLVAFGIGLSLVAKHFLPAANVASGSMLIDSLRERPVGAAIAGAAYGAVWGICFGFVFEALKILPSPIGPPQKVTSSVHYRNSIFTFTICGLFLGVSGGTWFATLSLFCIVWILHFGTTFFTRERKSRGSIPCTLWPTTLALLLWWKPLVEFCERMSVR